MIEKINNFKYTKYNELLHYNLSNGTEIPVNIKVTISVSEMVKGVKGLFFRAKLTESILNNSLYIDFFHKSSKELSFNDKINKVKQYLVEDPVVLVKLFELNVI